LGISIRIMGGKNLCTKKGDIGGGGNDPKPGEKKEKPDKKKGVHRGLIQNPIWWGGKGR